MIKSADAANMINKHLQSFYGFAKQKIVPSLSYSQTIYEDVLNRAVAPDANWLDIGCGHQMLPPWRFEQEKQLFKKARHVVGIDYDFPSLLKHRTVKEKVNGSADCLPFKDDYFDVATANMVVEHLDAPQIQFAEVNRILKPNGIFIFHTVNETGYFARLRKLVPDKLAKRLSGLLDGRTADDVFPVHYRANREEVITRLARETNFAVERIKFISSDAIFAVVPPLAVVELAWLKLLMRRSFQHLRTNIIVILKKNGEK